MYRFSYWTSDRSNPTVDIVIFDKEGWGDNDSTNQMLLNYLNKKALPSTFNIQTNHSDETSEHIGRLTEPVPLCCYFL